jgi:hypothetical protein
VEMFRQFFPVKQGMEVFAWHKPGKDFLFRKGS